MYGIRQTYYLTAFYFNYIRSDNRDEIRSEFVIIGKFYNVNPTLSI